MARPHTDEEAEKPLDPAAERVRRKLVRFVAINLGLLFVAVMAVLAAVVYQSGIGTDSADFGSENGPEIAGQVLVPAGTRILSHSLSGDRLSFDTQDRDGGRVVLIYDWRAGRLAARVTVREE